MFNLQEQPLAVVNERIIRVVVSEDDSSIVRKLANRLGLRSTMMLILHGRMRSQPFRAVLRMTTRSKEMIVEETEEEAEKDAVVRLQGDSDNEPTSSCPQTR
jgi:GMP synthase PP-ATPase subunit